ncbi:glycerophosphodiester phosphodiesterase family protein [Micromonospora sp. HM5-17]|jgi:glycerophosphoryl diester phosphodiesterase|uniref:glycerophosphodiester phosphodiesterase n=1 Tax=Micromonospora sp. HM5-17 TaxID=2487710 RepID=UPI000F4943AE|nr:glycerophosphodiester phosphodiesterase family protein [Micromonospora sp. HM5-17]ROT28188.1 glycerophosphodiester phosphodiesterase [Micromonospora sp. HM5-17]
MTVSPSRSRLARAARGPIGARTRIVAALTALAVPAAAAVVVAAASTPAVAEPDDVVVSEDFSSGVLPAGWRIVDGTWKVENGRLRGTSTSSTANNKLTFGRHMNDFRFEATVRFESVQSATRWAALGLDVPADGATPWWIATMRSGTTANNGLEFAQRTTANTWNVTATGAAPYAAGTGRDIRVAIEVHGSQARWFFDGVERLRTASLQRSTDGGQALFVNGATVSFDDVKVTELAPNGYLRPKGSPLTVIAHRGASSAAPENTLVAQEVARRAGADWIENDVQPSRDGVPFVLHDATVDRTTDGTGNIRDLTAAQLKALDAGSWFAPHYAGARIPTLAEQLADLRTRGGNLLLEIKGRHTRDEVARIVQVIRDERMTGRVFLQSFEVDALRHAHDLAPELPLGLLRSTLDADPVAVATELHLTAYNPNGTALLTRPSVIADLHRAGVAVMAWTMDSASQWQQLEEAGVDAVITNRPAELAGWNAALLQRQQPAAPTVAITSPAPNAQLDRAQAPVVAVAATGAETVSVTLDGTPVTVGERLDLATLTPGSHTLVATATGPTGTTSVTSTVTVAVTRAGLGYLVLTSGAKPKAVAWMSDRLGSGRYAELARYADREAGRLIPAGVARIIAADARTLAAR